MIVISAIMDVRVSARVRVNACVYACVCFVCSRTKFPINFQAPLPLSSPPNLYTFKKQQQFYNN